MTQAPIYFKIFLPSAHAAEAMAEALFRAEYLVGYKEDYLVGFEESEFDAVVEEVRKHYPTLQMIKYDKEPPKVVESAPCWNCGSIGAVDEGQGKKCSSCGAEGEQ